MDEYLVDAPSEALFNRLRNHCSQGWSVLNHILIPVLYSFKGRRTPCTFQRPTESMSKAESVQEGWGHRAFLSFYPHPGSLLLFAAEPAQVDVTGGTSPGQLQSRPSLADRPEDGPSADSDAGDPHAQSRRSSDADMDVTSGRTGTG